MYFSELEFDESKHIYTLDGVQLPSVTTLMKPLSEAYYGSINEDVLNNAAKRGTEVHQAIENFLLFGIEDISQEHAGYLTAFKAWWKAYTPQLITTESRVYHKILRYAGTVDLSCAIEGKTFCIDFKTSTQIVDMLVRVQLEAYARAYASQGIKFGKKAVVHLQNTGQFDMKMYQIDDTEAWEVFGSLLTINNYLNKNRR
jgi:gamma-glutamylcyclotransferase (GGCT)/AIG2-like uncharacterized protein YtfP